MYKESHKKTGTDQRKLPLWPTPPLKRKLSLSVKITSLIVEKDTRSGLLSYTALLRIVYRTFYLAAASASSKKSSCFVQLR